MRNNQKTAFETYVMGRVREKRRELGLSQEAVASILDTNRSFIGQVESPKSPLKYSLNQINILAAEWKCSPKDFLPDLPIIVIPKKKNK